MENYIKNLFDAVKAAYPTVNFYAWDVVNKAILDDGKPRNPGAQEQNPNYSPWVKIFGDNSFIKYAFQFAKKYGIEGCKYYYNDFNEYMPQKTPAIIQMVKEVNLMLLLKILLNLDLKDKLNIIVILWMFLLNILNLSLLLSSGELLMIKVGVLQDALFFLMKIILLNHAFILL